MAEPAPQRQFMVALERARLAWTAADPVSRAALAGCELVPHTDGAPVVAVPFFGARHTVTHPAGEVTSPSGKTAHPAVAVALLHYLLTADGTPLAGRWVAFRELPDGMFYAQAFAGHPESMLATRFGAALAEFRHAAAALGGLPLDLADASYHFLALPRVPLALLLWEGDDEFPGQARILFDAHAGHYLPTEDLSGLGDWLGHRLTR